MKAGEIVGYLAIVVGATIARSVHINPIVRWGVIIGVFLAIFLWNRRPKPEKTDVEKTRDLPKFKPLGK
jgi:uncharacterized membrane protein YjfL (UPF0719 family)